MLKITISGKTTKELQEQITDLYRSTCNVVEINTAKKLKGASEMRKQVIEAAYAQDQGTEISEKKAEEVSTARVLEQSKSVVESWQATKEDVNNALKKVMEKFGGQAGGGVKNALLVLDSFGVKKTTELKTDQYNAVVTKCNEVLALEA